MPPTQTGGSQRLIASPAPSVKGRRSDLAGYVRWTRAVDRAPLPADPELLSRNIEDYLVARAKDAARPKTIRRIASTLGILATSLGAGDGPLAARRQQAARGARKLAARNAGPRRETARLAPSEISRMLRWLETEAALPATIRRRDVAILRVFRDILARSAEISGLRLCDYRPGNPRAGTPATLLIAASKTDREGSGALCPIEPATAEAIEAWIEVAALDGADPLAPLFRPLEKNGARRRGPTRPIDPEDAAAIVMRHATASGILRGRGQTPVTGHAIRRGVARALWERGVPAETIQILGRWKSLEILFGYIGAPEAKRGAAELLAG